MTDQFDARKTRAAAWFRTLRDRIVESFEALEDQHGTGTPGRFEVTPTTRADGGATQAASRAASSSEASAAGRHMLSAVPGGWRHRAGSPRR